MYSDLYTCDVYASKVVVSSAHLKMIQILRYSLMQYNAFSIYL